ncbi:MAG: hypothetical protein ACFFEJ_15210 [Candidatus Thorarchaeota archaeon]
MFSNRESRRKDDFKDITQRCDWCGRYVSKPRKYYRPNHRETGIWCSSDCRAAGQYYMNWGIEIIILIFGIFVVSLYLLPTSSVWTGDIFNGLFGLIFMLLFFGAILWGFYREISRGNRIRNGESRVIPGEKVPRTYMELDRIHEMILHFIETFPANNGVSRRQIELHLKENGILMAHTNLALNELIEHGYIAMTRKMRYVLQ